MLTYAVFFRGHGVRLMQQLTKPPMTPLTQLSLPVNSTYHYVSSDTQELGVPNDDEVTQLLKSSALVEHVTSYDGIDPIGNPKPQSMNAAALINEYHAKHREFKRLNQNVGLTKNPRVLTMVSYNLTARAYRYMENRYTAYYQWHNLYATVWAKVARLTDGGERHQYLQLHIPSVLPALSHLNNAQNRASNQTLERFNTDSLRCLLDLWDWAGPNRERSLLGRLTSDQLNRVNLLLVCGGQWTCVNLGVINSWRQSTDKDTHAPGGIQKMTPEALQKRMLRMFMSILETTTVATDAQMVPESQKDAPFESTSDSADNRADDFEQGRKARPPVDISDYETSLQVKPAAATMSATTGKSARKQTLVDIIKAGATSTTQMNDEELIEDLPEISDDDIDKDLAQLEVINEAVATHDQALLSYQPYTPPPAAPEQGVVQLADDMARRGLLSAAEHRRMIRLSKRPHEIKDPHSGTHSLADYSQISAETLAVAETTPLAESIPGVIDETMLSSSLKQFDNRYIREVLPKDIANVALGVQKAGFAVQDYSVTRVDDYTDSFDIHTIKVVPVVGKPSTIRIQLPRVNEDGTFRASGVKYRMRKQRGDVPIRKTDPATVALTSYYSKMFVVRSERGVFNYPQWLMNHLVAKGIDPADDTVVDLKLSNVFYHQEDLPRIYSTVAQRVVGFRSGEYEFFFDYARREEFFGADTVKVLESGGKRERGWVVVGQSKDGYVVLGYDNNFYFVSKKKADVGMVALGPIESIIQLPLDRRPVEVAEVDIFGKTIPVGFLLAAHVGLGNLIKTVGVEPRRVRTGSTYGLTDDEYILKFEDEALIFNRNDRVAALLFNGFNRYHRDLKHYSVYDFDQRDAYGKVLEDNDIGSRWVREFDLMFKMWVDHITRDLLIEMEEPTDLFNLFIKSCHYLATDKHPAEGDSNYTRDRGYERLAGLAYFEIVKAMRAYASKPVNANASLDVNPQAAWMAVLKDQSVMPIEESNPIHALKEMEVVVFSGSGGRSGRSMTDRSRGFDRTNMGLVSEATVDSADVGTITYLTADPSYKSLRGTSRRVSGKIKPTKMVSTSMLTAPGADHDDPKRICFISIQNSQTTHCHGYTPMPMRTGYERVLAHRTNPLFAKTARADGVVEALTDNTISIKYKDGEIAHYEIGRRFGTWAGHVTPHDIVTGLKQGQKVKAGDVLLYNERYFAPDLLDPSQVVLKMATLGRVAFLESSDTLEDSSALSPEFARRMRTDTTHIRNMKVGFDQEIRNLVKAGEAVDLESILCTIHNATAGNTDIYNEQALSTLSNLSTTSPKAKVVGQVDRVEVLYTGELEDMSPTLRALAERSDNEIRRLNKQLGRKAVDGRVDVGYRVDGHPLELDAAVVRLYITGPTDMGVGDKAVFANQAKSVVARILQGINETEDGRPIDAMFGYQSLANRIVLSAELMGTTNSLLLEIGDRAVEAYYSK